MLKGYKIVPTLHLYRTITLNYGATYAYMALYYVLLICFYKKTTRKMIHRCYKSCLILTSYRKLYSFLKAVILHAWFHLHGTSRPVRSSWKATKFLPTVGLEPTTLIIQVRCSPDWASRACWRSFVIYLVV